MTQLKPKAKTKAKKTHSDIFSNIYKKRIWASKDSTPLSGAGSTVTYNLRYIDFLQNLIHDPAYDIHSIADLGCGDWTFSREIDFSNKNYLGLDCVPSVIEDNTNRFSTPHIQFTLADFSQTQHLTPILQRDLVILKDVLQHWDDSDVSRVLDFLTDTSPSQNNRIKYILLVHGKRKESDFQKKRSVQNYYHYSNLNFKTPPLNKYNIQHLFDYKFKEVGLITLTS